MSAPRSGGSAAADAAQPSPAAPADWYDSEPALGAAAGATVSRLARRARVSWRAWVSAAVLLAVFATIQQARRPPAYEVTVLLRVVEGAVNGPSLAEGEIQAQIEDLAFTTDRLLGLMRKHPASFPRALNDQSLALDDFRERMSVAVSEDDFIEDRQPGDPPRSARITLSFRGTDPELTWTVAKELQALLVESGLEQQRDRARGIQDAATAAVRAAELDVSSALHDGTGTRNTRLQLAQDRLLRAQQLLGEAAVASRATAARLALRFDVIDPGRRPSRPNRRAVLGGAFATVLFLSLLSFSLLAGAYDPRILDVADLGGLGAPMLGHFPALGVARDGHAGHETE